ncbi:membrane protein [Candidatus Korobacter versatilis]|nr:membrane protein [Candidatus Koribacter versatilis]
MLLQAFTLFHVAISLAAIVSGFVVVSGLLNNRAYAGTTSFFLATTALTSITGFLFPFHGITPGIVLGVLSLIVLAIAYWARRQWNAAQRLRKTYLTTMVIALYFNFFVLVAQSFQKVPALHALAPTQKEPPFQIAQGVVLVLFITLGILSVRRFHGEGSAKVLSRAA